MKRVLYLCLLPSLLFASEKAQPESTAPSSAAEIDNVSETFGHLLVQNLQDPTLKLNIAKVILGMQDELAGKPAPMKDQDYIEAITKLQEEGVKALAAQNLAAAEEFLVKNGKEKGVVTLDHGKLEYIILTPGHGEIVKAHSTPLINYTGTLLDGTVFSSSTDAKEPIALPLDQTIPGFTEGVIGMKEGEKRKLFIHPDLAYGTSGQLPPNSLLIFEIEVVKADSELDEESLNELTQKDLEEVD